MFAGIAPVPAPPFLIAFVTRALSGFSSSRFGPIVPDVPASESVWQVPQDWVKICLPSADAARATSAAAAATAGLGAGLLGRLVAATTLGGGRGLPASARFLGGVVVDHERRDAEAEADDDRPEHQYARGCTAQEKRAHE